MIECIFPYAFKVYTGQLTRKDFCSVASQPRERSLLMLVCQSRNKTKGIKKKAYEKVFFQQLSTYIPSAYLFLKWSKPGR